MAARRRRFGLVRKLPSGRWQASYIDPEGIRRPGPETFRTKRESEQWLSYIETEMLRGEWRNPDDQRVPLLEFGARWIKERPGLRPRTIDLYASVFSNHIEPMLGKRAIGDIDPARVREWRAYLLANGRSETMTAKAYRLLRAILMTAADDGIIARNPCRIRGAGTEPTAERPTLTVPQVFALAALMPKPYDVMVLVTAFGSLRWGEVTALRRGDVDTKSGTVRVRTAFGRPYSGPAVRGAPKSRAGLRVLSLPGPIAELLREHLGDERVGTSDDALIFTGDKGGVITRNNFNKRVDWSTHVETIGLPGLHFHDLRHTGNTLAALTGASLRDLMTRMGHDSMRAALVYLHNTQGADPRIAGGMEALIDQAEQDAKKITDDAEATADEHGEEPDDGSSAADSAAS